MAYFDLEDYKKALEYFNLSSKINCASDLYNKLAIAYFYTKDYDKSIKYYNKVILKLNEKTPFHIYNNLAILYYLKKDYSSILQTYHKYLDNYNSDNNFASYNIFLLSFTLLSKRLIKYNDFLALFEKSIIKSINKSINRSNIENNNISSLYEIMEYDINALKLILENKIKFKSCKEFLKNKLSEKQLKAIEPIINCYK